MADPVQNQDEKVLNSNTPQADSRNSNTVQSQNSKFTENISHINRESKERAIKEKADTLGMNYVDIASVDINPDLLKIIDPKQAEENLIIAFYRVGKKVRVALAHPTNPNTLKIINALKAAGYFLNINLASDDGIKEALKLYKSDQYKEEQKMETSIDEAKINTYENELKTLNSLGKELIGVNSDEAVNKLGQGAIRTRASDIHIEPREDIIKIRFRVDGMLREVTTIDRETYHNLSNQIKYQSKMKVNVTDIPQDGRYDFILNDRTIDMRVSSMPTHFGESFVIRLLDSHKQLSTFEDLGYSGRTLQQVESLVELSHGMILMTGPTGSGKTTSLYTLLSQFNQPEKKVITLEDPIEYQLEGITQSQIIEDKGYTFSSGLRTVLRQDPEVVMIGEIRDKETANTAAQAALTGHVILSTLHTNSAIESITRLKNIGLPEFMIAPALHTIIGQRLVRRVCPDCSKMRDITKSEITQLEVSINAIMQVRPDLELTMPTQVPEPVGCEKCSHSGYKGRICLVEIFQIDYEMRDLILNKASTSKLIEAARKKGMITMKEDGILKVIEGLTDLKEVYRVTSIKN